ncbi:hypothetical protein HW555_005072 [Spodoptera exigua]|uniref:Uncharacterized protein n=1 Tax=Spodoptera exigua TaxID=7107 RepID=A0A835GKF2_SPOEX|nr:hypothetical protein HW555_005072 [Spodoptera exigua]
MRCVRIARTLVRVLSLRVSGTSSPYLQLRVHSWGTRTARANSQREPPSVATNRKERSNIKKSLVAGTGANDVYISKWFASEYFTFLNDKDKPMPTTETTERATPSEGISRRKRASTKVQEELVRYVGSNIGRHRNRADGSVGGIGVTYLGALEGRLVHLLPAWSVDDDTHSWRIFALALDELNRLSILSHFITLCRPTR